MAPTTNTTTPTRSSAHILRIPCIAYLGLGLGVGLALAGHGNSTAAAITQIIQTPCSHPTPTTTPSPTNKIGAHPTVTVTVGTYTWRVALDGVATRTRLDAYTKARGKYVLVLLTVRNQGKQPHAPFGELQLTIRDTQGRSYDLPVQGGCIYDTASTTFGRDTITDEVQPGLTARIVLPFDVAPDAHGFVLQNTDLSGTGAVTTLFKLGI